MINSMKIPPGGGDVKGWRFKPSPTFPLLEHSRGHPQYKYKTSSHCTKQNANSTSHPAWISYFDVGKADRTDGKKNVCVSSLA